jgi:hypothetical protein
LHGCHFTNVKGSDKIWRCDFHATYSINRTRTRELSILFVVHNSPPTSLAIVLAPCWSDYFFGTRVRSWCEFRIYRRTAVRPLGSGFLFGYFMSLYHLMRLSGLGRDMVWRIGSIQEEVDVAHFNEL